MQPTQPTLKRKNQSPLRVIVNQWGCLFGILMLGLGSAMGMLGAIFIGPQLLGFDLTATAFMDREILLAATEVELEVQAQNAVSRSTAFALDVLSTQAILNNEADLLAQTATQSAQNDVATATAQASLNAQRQTQVSNDFAGTQAALDANATQVALDFRNTQSALGIITTQSSQNVAPTPTGRYTFDFSQFRFGQTTWTLSEADDWALTDTGLRAAQDGAFLFETEPTILRENGFINQYTLTAEIMPAVTMNSDYWLVFGLNDETGYAAHFSAEILTVTEVGLYQFDVMQLEDGLPTENITVIQRVSASSDLIQQSQLSVAIDDTTVKLLVDDEIVLEIPNQNIGLGGIGMQLPQQATLHQLSLSDDVP